MAYNGTMYRSLSGYGITYGYFLTNLVIFLVGLTIIIFNVLIIFLLIRKPRHWDASCLFIVNLAISDVILGVFTVYNVLYNLVHYKNVYECLFRFGLLNGVIGQSKLSLLALSFDRYVKIISPHFYVRMFQEKYVKMYTLFTWVFSLVSGFTPLVWKSNSKYEYFCGYFGIFANDYLIIIWTIAFIIIILICLMYMHILIISFSKIKETPRYFDQSVTSPKEMKKRHSTPVSLWWRPTKTVLLIVSLNIFCLIPVGLFSILVLSGTLDNITMGDKGTILTFLSPLLLLNSLANPVIYAFKIPDVKRTFEKEFSWCKRKKKSNSVQVISSEGLYQYDL